MSSASPPAEQPAAQLALLHAREPHDLARIVGAPLHERERLQHGVVEVRGDLGALVGTDALAPLADELVHQLPHPGPMINAKPTSTTAAPIDAALQRAPRVDAHEERAEPGRDARDAGDDPRERAAPRPEQHRDRVGRVGREPIEERPVGRLGRVVARARREHRQADHRRAQRPDDHVAGPRADRADEQQHAEHDRGERDRGDRVGRARGGSVAVRPTGSEQPARAVEQRADPAGERQHEEAAAHDVRVDTDRVAEPGGDARDDAAVLPADEAVPFEAHPVMIAPRRAPSGSGHTPSAGAALRGRLGDLPDGAGRPRERTIEP